MIAVSGATGLLGSHLLYELTHMGCEGLLAFYRSESRKSLVAKVFDYYPEGQELFKKITWVKLDLMEVGSIDQVFEQYPIHQMYHCAAIVSFDPKEADYLIEYNRSITANLINASIHYKVKEFCHVSSVAALGRDPGGDFQKLIDENTEFIEGKHNSKYAISKYAAELEAWRGQEEGLDVVVVNPSIILGPGYWNEGSGKLFSTYANGFKFYTTGVNAFVDVRDVAKAMYQLMQQKCFGERFILAAENLNYRAFFNLLCQALGLPQPSIEIKPWMIHIFWRIEKIRSFILQNRPLVTKETAHSSISTYYYSNDKVKNRLNFTFRSIDESLQDFSKIYLKEKAH